VQAPASGALDDFRPLVLGDDTLHLHQQLVLGLLSNGPLDEVHAHAPRRQLLEHHLLVHIIAR